MRSSRTSLRGKTPPSASMAEVGVGADRGQVSRTPNTAFVSVAPPSATGPQPTSVKTSSAHPSLIALARLLGRQAAREWLAGGGERGGDE